MKFVEIFSKFYHSYVADVVFWKKFVMCKALEGQCCFVLQVIYWWNHMLLWIFLFWKFVKLILVSFFMCIWGLLSLVICNVGIVCLVNQTNDLFDDLFHIKCPFKLNSKETYDCICEGWEGIKHITIVAKLDVVSLVSKRNKLENNKSCLCNCNDQIVFASTYLCNYNNQFFILFWFDNLIPKT